MPDFKAGWYAVNKYADGSRFCLYFRSTGAIAPHGATLVEQMKAWSDELWERLQRREGTIAK